MTKALNEFNKEVEQKKSRIEELKQSISDNELVLTNTEKEYKAAVANDTNNIDDLFHEMESLQGKIKADKHKLGTLNTVTDEHLKESAINVLRTFHTDVKDVYGEKLEKVNERIKKLKVDYIKEVDALQDEAYQIINKRNAKVKEYSRFMHSNNLTQKEVGQVHRGLYKELDDARHGLFKNKYAEVEFATVNANEVKN